MTLYHRTESFELRVLMWVVLYVVMASNAASLIGAVLVFITSWAIFIPPIPGQTVTAAALEAASVTQQSAAQPEPFNILTLTTSHPFTPTTSLLPGFPPAPDGSGNALAGYQGGVYINGLALFTPWTYGHAILNGTLLAYTGGPGGTFNCPTSEVCASDWTWFDMTTLIPFCPSGFGTCPTQDSASGYTCQAIVDHNNIVYFIPGAAQQFPVMMSLNPFGTGGITNSANYAYFSSPAVNAAGNPLADGSPTSKYGWCTGVFDGRYIYYAPTLGGGLRNSNLLRYDTQAGVWPSGFVITNFTHFNLSTVSGGAANCCFESSAYDGHQNIYLLPTTNPTHGRLVIYDTLAGGGFNSPSSYKSYDLANLGMAGNPAVIGTGNLLAVQNQNDYIGAQMVWIGTTEYLYGAPFASNPTIVGHSHSQAQILSTVFRVPVATCSVSATTTQICNGMFTPIDITSPDTIWEIYDLANLASNPAWITAGFPAPIYKNSALVNQISLGGFQLTWLNTHNSADPIVGFVADYGKFFVRHHASHMLSDPTGWDVALRPSRQTNGCMGGGYDTVNQLLYTSCPNPFPQADAWQLGPL